MLIKTKLSEKDYINANLTILYSRFVIKFITGIALLALVFGNLSFLVLPAVPWSASNLIGPLLMLFFLPAMTWLTSKKNYSADRRLGEEVEYRFDNVHLVAKGESFTTESTWDKVYKVTQTKKWLFIWQSPQNANMIAKKDIWPGDIIELKEILDAYKVTNTL